MTRPTKRGASVAVAAIGSWAVGRLLGIDEFYVLSVAAAVALLAGFAVVGFSGSAVAVRRTVSRTRLPAGGHAQVVVDLRNESRLPLPTLLGEDACDDALMDEVGAARFVVPALSRGSTLPASYVLHGGLRGRYVVGPLLLRIRDPFALFERTRRYRATNELVVYPAIEDLPGAVSLGRHSGSGSSRSRRLFNAGDEFHTMREYNDGDDLRQVHWRSTARRGKLMVRQNEMPWDAYVTLLADTRAAQHHGTGKDSSLERTVSAAASILWHMDAHGYRARLVTEHDARPGVATGKDALLDRLAVLEPTRGRSLEPVLAQLRSTEAQGLLVAVIPASDPQSSTEMTTLLQAGRAFSGRVVMIVDTGGAGSGERAQRLIRLFRAANWRAGVLGFGDSLGDTWADAMSGRQAPSDAGTIAGERVGSART
jgi:uncharacterized protein (DUF58 family)